jgi:gentisate 1,2-dioxygenase
MLGRAWWAEEKRTAKKYLASRHVLDLATKHPAYTLLRPKKIKIPNVKTSVLNYLEIEKVDLNSFELRKIIKNAYRKQAKIHHPDLGGYAPTFRKLYAAYQELLYWAENPTFIHRRGFPGRWFYDGENKKWVQPLPIHK